MFQRISVWLDEFAPDAGAFAHAFDWANRLYLGLHGVATAVNSPCWLNAKSGARFEQMRGEKPVQTAPATSIVEACTRACTGKIPNWDIESSAAPDTVPAKPRELLVFGEYLPVTTRKSLLRRSLQVASTSVLVCPQPYCRLSRVLILNQPSTRCRCFLEQTAEVCRALRVPTVILTVARSEDKQAAYEQLAQECWAAQHLDAEFDSLIGADMRLAISQAARWRRCTHVFLERQPLRSRWGWLRGDDVELLRGIDGLSCLAFGHE